MDLSEAQVQLRVEPEVVQTSRDGEASLEGGDRMVMISCDEEIGKLVNW